MFGGAVSAAVAGLHHVRLTVRIGIRGSCLVCGKAVVLLLLVLRDEWAYVGNIDTKGY